MAKLTKTYIDKITPPASGYDLHWDVQDRGFGLRVTKDGKRTYIVQGRVNGKEARITVGAHGVAPTANPPIVAGLFLTEKSSGSNTANSLHGPL